MNKNVLRRAFYAQLFLVSHFSLLILGSSCTPEPPLHLYDAQDVTFDLPIIDLDLNVYWDYETAFGLDYNWEAEWYYGWDEEDRRIYGVLGYAEPKVFCLRRYYTGDIAEAPHTGVIANTVDGNHFQGRYDWGFWDLLVWNQITTLDGVQSLVFDEQSSLDSVTAYTNPSMRYSRYHAPRYTRSFYEPEPLFASYEKDIEINRDLEGFVFDEQRNAWVKDINMYLHPITYIYLTQVILHHNNRRIIAIDGSAALSGMARSTTLNTGRAGDDAVAVSYGTRMKFDMPLVPYGTRTEEVADTVERVDIIGGRLMTFGICGLRANHFSRADNINDPQRHYIDMNMQFNNGIDSTFVFDVTDQVRRRYKGGVITVELDLDTIPIPSRSGGSGFDAVVLEPDTITHVIEM